MSDTVIQVEGLGKKYRIGAAQERYTALRDVVTVGAKSLGRRLLGRPAVRPRFEDFWALRDVSFEVKRGECVGIIGRNGAGKSTLLKLLSRITEPTTGRFRIRGRVSSLLEVGTGFHPELTGRENIFLNGAILGMRRAEITRKFDEIVAFAEVEKFLDTPVKHFSSGMYMRLAFAVAAHLEPEVLVVDEVLAVGDAQFQKKCLGKMDEVSKGGRTVLFVSHNMAAVQALCRHAIWLRSGRQVEYGEATEVIQHYLSNGAETSYERVWNDPVDAPQNQFIRLDAVRLKPTSAENSGIVSVHDPFALEFEYSVLRGGFRLNLSLHVFSRDETCAFAAGSLHEPNWDGKLFPEGQYRTSCHVPGDLLNNGTHRVGIMFVRDTSVLLFHVPEALVFDVQDSAANRGAWYGPWPGAVRIRLDWKTEQMAAGFAPTQLA